MTHSHALRPIVTLPVSGVTPNAIDAWRPEFRWVDPCSLLVEESYQRDLSEKSHRLIRRIVAGWDWKAMKPPICALDATGALVVIDGQHTAIAAASHPGVGQIPVMVVEAAALADRANAFVKHNSDRIAMTGMQVHHAALSAADIGEAMAEACRRAGAKILRNPPFHGTFQVGETVAVVTIQSTTASKGVHFMARVLKILVEAKRAPLATTEIKAVAMLLSEPEWKGAILDEDLAALIRSKSAKDWQAHAEIHIRKGLKIPMSRALAIDWFKTAPKRRRAA